MRLCEHSSGKSFIYGPDENIKNKLNAIVTKACRVYGVELSRRRPYRRIGLRHNDYVRPAKYRITCAWEYTISGLGGQALFTSCFSGAGIYDREEEPRKHERKFKDIGDIK